MKFNFRHLEVHETFTVINRLIYKGVYTAMKRLCHILFFTIIFFIISTLNQKVFATSWAELDAKEVEDRAEVIVIGSYDFSSKPKESKFVFQGFEFKVKGVYRGDATDKIIAGIDEFDVGWAIEFQEEGGEFLLFLEQSEDTSFLVPVGGPNGIVHVLDGKITHTSNKNKKIYQAYLNMESKAPSVDEKGASKQGFTSIKYLPYIGAVGGLGIVLLVYFYKKRRK